jgi:hypothetical protein
MGNLRAVRLLPGHTKLESTARYLGIEVDDALSISEHVELYSNTICGPAKSQGRSPMRANRRRHPVAYLLLTRSHCRLRAGPSRVERGRYCQCQRQGGADSGHSSSSKQRGARDHPGNPGIENDARFRRGLRGCVLRLHASRGLPELVDPRPQASIDVRHETLTCYLWTLVVAIRLTRRERTLDGVQVVVRDSRQQMSDAIEAGFFLVV